MSRKKSIVSKRTLWKTGTIRDVAWVERVKLMFQVRVKVTDFSWVSYKDSVCHCGQPTFKDFLKHKRPRASISRLISLPIGIQNRTKKGSWRGLFISIYSSNDSRIIDHPI